MSGDIIPYPGSRDAIEAEIASLRIRIWARREAGHHEEAARLFARLSRLIANAGVQRRRHSQPFPGISAPSQKPASGLPRFLAGHSDDDLPPSAA